MSDDLDREPLDLSLYPAPNMFLASGSVASCSVAFHLQRDYDIMRQIEGYSGDDKPETPVVSTTHIPPGTKIEIWERGDTRAVSIKRDFSRETLRYARAG